MKKYKTIILMCIFTTLGIIIGRYTSKNDIYEEDKEKIKNNTILSMMLETDTNSKTYIQSTDSSWPSEGYMFNENLSKCEQGSKLSWDDTNKKVVMEGNSSDKCYVFFDKYNPVKINNYSITSSGNKITITIDASSGTGTISKYYYSKDDGVTYTSSASSTYTYANLDEGTYKVKAYVEDSNGKRSKIISKTIEITINSLAQYVISQYTGTQGENGLYYHDSTLTNGAEDNSYRYAGKNPNNYICFGSEATTCPTDNLYRIIGVFDENNHGVTGEQLVKIIKNTSIGTYKWEGNGGINDWSTASLSATLNGEYLTNNLLSYSNKIATVTWKIGGFTNIDNKISTANAKNMFTNEFSSSKKTTEGKLGLMYVSDYGFATSSSNWSAYLINYENETIRNNNYLYSGLNEWTLTSYPGTDTSMWTVTANGSITDNNDVSNLMDTRPAFYLTSDTSYIRGSGTLADPYRVN